MAAESTTDVIASLSSGAVDAYLTAGDLSPAGVQVFLASLPESQRAAAVQLLIAGGIDPTVAQNALDALSTKFPKWLAALLGMAAGVGASVALKRRRRR